MSAQFQCPQCSAAFPYSPNLAGRKVRCKACQHIFVVTAPAEPANEKVTAAVLAKSPVPSRPGPPPLPPKSAVRRPVDDDDRPKSGSRTDLRPKKRRDEDLDDAPRDRPAAEFQPSGGIGTLLLLIAGCALVFLLIAAVIGFILWPSSTPPRADAPSGQVAVAPARLSPALPLPDAPASATLSRTLPPDLRPLQLPTARAEPTATGLSRLQVTA